MKALGVCYSPEVITSAFARIVKFARLSILLSASRVIRGPRNRAVISDDIAHSRDTAVSISRCKRASRHVPVRVVTERGNDKNTPISAVPSSISSISSTKSSSFLYDTPGRRPIFVRKPNPAALIKVRRKPLSYLAICTISIQAMQTKFRRRKRYAAWKITL